MRPGTQSRVKLVNKQTCRTTNALPYCMKASSDQGPSRQQPPQVSLTNRTVEIGLGGKLISVATPDKTAEETKRQRVTAKIC